MWLDLDCLGKLGRERGWNWDHGRTVWELEPIWTVAIHDRKEYFRLSRSTCLWWYCFGYLVNQLHRRVRPMNTSGFSNLIPHVSLRLYIDYRWFDYVFLSSFCSRVAISDSSL